MDKYEQHLCDRCQKQKTGCKFWDNIKTQPKLTLACCDHFVKRDKKDSAQ